jgi:anti-sigma factor RsiW
MAVRCSEVAERMPKLLEDGVDVDVATREHIEACLRCQAELVRYRRMLRGLRSLRDAYLEPGPDAVSQTLAALWEAGERQAVRSALSGRRLAYAGAVGGLAVAAGSAATLAVVLTRSRHRTSV